MLSLILMNKFIKNMLLVVISLTIAVISVEFFLRIQAKPKSSDFSNGNIQDTELYYRLQPNFKTADGVYFYNEYGMRNVAISKKKPKNVFRILCFGGSTTFGTGVSNTQTWPTILQSLLRAGIDTEGNVIEVLNVGMCGYLSDHSLYRLEHELLEFSPNVVIVMDGLNDVATAIESTPTSRARRPPLYTHQTSVTLSLLQKTMVYKYIDKAFVFFRSYFQIKKYDETELTNAAHRAAEIYTSNILKMKTLCESAGSSLIVLNHPWIFNFQLGPPDNYSDLKKRFPITYDDFISLWIGAKELRKANEHIAKLGVPVVNLQKTIDAIKNKYGLFGVGDYIHFNSKGNYVIASAVCQDLVATYWPQDKRHYDLMAVVNETVFN